MNTLAKQKSPNLSNHSAAKLLTLMESMSTLDEPIRLQDLAKRLDMNASTVLRFLTPLLERGYVAQDPETNRYHLTLKLCGVAQNITTRLSLRNIAIPFIRQIAHVYKETASLSVEQDMQVLYIDSVTVAAKTLMALQRIGHVAPLHCTGVGKLFLLEYTPERLDRLIATRGLPRFTATTITDREELLRRLETVRANDYSIDDAECEEGMRCIAAPIRDYTGRIVACVSVNGPSTRMTDAHIFEHLPFLLENAKQISRQLGWDGEEK